MQQILGEAVYLFDGDGVTAVDLIRGGPTAASAFLSSWFTMAKNRSRARWSCCTSSSRRRSAMPALASNS